VNENGEAEKRVPTGSVGVYEEPRRASWRIVDYKPLALCNEGRRDLSPSEGQG